MLSTLHSSRYPLNTSMQQLIVEGLWYLHTTDKANPNCFLYNNRPNFQAPGTWCSSVYIWEEPWLMKSYSPCPVFLNIFLTITSPLFKPGMFFRGSSLYKFHVDSFTVCFLYQPQRGIVSQIPRVFDVLQRIGSHTHSPLIMMIPIGVVHFL